MEKCERFVPLTMFHLVAFVLVLDNNFNILDVSSTVRKLNYGEKLDGMLNMNSYKLHTSITGRSPFTSYCRSAGPRWSSTRRSEQPSTSCFLGVYGMGGPSSEGGVLAGRHSDPLKFCHVTITSVSPFVVNTTTLVNYQRRLSHLLQIRISLWGWKCDSSRHVEEVSRVDRFSSDKIRPIRVKFVGVASKKEILQRVKSLSSGKFNKVFIAPDLTKKQQEHDKDLRKHVKLFREEYKDQEIKIKIKGWKVAKKNEQGKQYIVLYDPRKEIKKN